MALRYRVDHAFHATLPGETRKTYFTRDNAQDVKRLPRTERDQLIQSGNISEFDDRKPGLPADVAADIPPQG